MSVYFLHFLPTLKIKGSLRKKHENELSDKHAILQTWSIVSVMFRKDHQESIVIGDLKSTAYRNRSLIFGYWTRESKCGVSVPFILIADVV